LPRGRNVNGQKTIKREAPPITDHCSPITAPFSWFMAVSRARQLLAVVETQVVVT